MNVNDVDILRFRWACSIMWYLPGEVATYTVFYFFCLLHKLMSLVKDPNYFYEPEVIIPVVPKRRWDVGELSLLAVNWWSDLRIKKGSWFVVSLIDCWKNKILFSVPLHFNAIHLTIKHLQWLLLYSDLVLLLDWCLRHVRLIICVHVNVSRFLLVHRVGVSVLYDACVIPVSICIQGAPPPPQQPRQPEQPRQPRQDETILIKQSSRWMGHCP